MNSEQQIAFDDVVQNKNILLTGSAGSGKSFTLIKIIEWANLTHKKIAVTATTGNAALLIGGRTIHSYLGIGLGTKTTTELILNVKKKYPLIIKKIQTIDILILEEISMLDAELFEKISEFIGVIRKKKELPFGGLQLVLCGDFCQICPIKGKYCFLSNIWKEMDIKVITLKTLIRQQDDFEFQNILESLKWGICTKSIIRKLKELRNTEFDKDIIPTILYGTNVNVDKINDEEYKKLVDNGAETNIYKTHYSEGTFAKNWATSCKVPELIELSIGSQVILSWNVSQDAGLVNGSKGVITGFNVNGPIVKFINQSTDIIVVPVTVKNEENNDISITFMPLKLAWALTLHKCQGATLNAVIIDLKSWDAGMAYTAISRVRNLKSVKLVGVIKASYFICSKDVINFYQKDLELLL